VKRTVQKSLFTPGQALRAPAGWDSQIFWTVGSCRWQGCQPHAPAAFTHLVLISIRGWVLSLYAPTNSGLCQWWHTWFMWIVRELYIVLFRWVLGIYFDGSGTKTENCSVPSHKKGGGGNFICIVIFALIMLQRYTVLGKGIENKLENVHNYIITARSLVYKSQQQR